MLRPIALLLALAATPVPAGERFAARYDFWLGGVHGAEMRVEAEWLGDRFAAAAEMRTTGLLGAIWDGSYRVAAEGRVVEGRPLPGSFRSESAFGRDRQTVEMDFEDARPVRVAAEPAYRQRPWELDPADQRGTADPLTAGLLLLQPEPAEALCDRSVDIFDGRRRSRITLGAPVRTGDRVACPAVYERIAGFSPKMMRRQTRWDAAVVFAVRPDGRGEVQEISLETGFGLAVVRRRN